MNRRQFLLALAVAVWAGPRAVAALVEEQKRREREQLIIAQLKYQAEQAIASLHREMLRQLYPESAHHIPYIFGIDKRAIAGLTLKGTYGITGG